MKRTHNPHRWSQRRTQALLSLLKTQAPPDFQTRVLARVHELHHAALTHQAGGAEPPGRWQGFCTWLKATIQVRPTALATAAGSVSMLLLGSSLVWWLSSPRGGDLTPPAEVVSLAGAPQSGEQVAGPHEELAVRTVDRESGQLAAYPPTSVDLIVSGTASPSPNERETISTEVPQEQAVIPSTALPSLQRTGEHPRVVQTQSKRSSIKRAEPGKTKRAKQG